MDINSLGTTGLGTAYLDNYRLGGDVVNQANSRVNGVSTFEEILRKRASSPHSPLPTPHSPSSAIDKTDKLYEQCLELEIFMMKTLISSMRNTIQKSGLIDEGFAGKMYEDMLYDEYAREFTKNANFGLAEMAYLELNNKRGSNL
jgi:flagellar protein FlgJ